MVEIFLISPMILMAPTQWPCRNGGNTAFGRVRRPYDQCV